MIGETLKKYREDTGLTLSDIALKLRIRIEHLKAIEDNAFERLPADVFTIGYIREYARLLSIDADPLVEAFKELKKPKPAPVKNTAEIIEKTSVEPQPKNRTPISTWIKIFTTIGAGAIAALILFTIMEELQHTSSDNTNNRIIVKLTKDIPVEAPAVADQKPLEQTESKAPEVKKSVPPIVINTAVKVPAEAPKKLPEQIKPKAADIKKDESPIAKEKRHKLKIVATENTWLHIETGEGEGQDVQLNKGDSNEWSSRKGFNIKIGNAGGVKLMFNGKDLGTPGERNKVLQLRLPKEGPTAQQP